MERRRGAWIDCYLAANSHGGLTLNNLIMPRATVAAGIGVFLQRPTRHGRRFSKALRCALRPLTRCAGRGSDAIVDGEPARCVHKPWVDGAGSMASAQAQWTQAKIPDEQHRTAQGCAGSPQSRRLGLHSRARDQPGSPPSLHFSTPGAISWATSKL